MKITDEQVELLPCPFCGSQPKMHTSSSSDERYGYNFTVSIRCPCGAKISKPSHEGKGGWCDDKGEAKASVIDAWNTRAPVAQSMVAQDERDAARYRWLREHFRFANDSVQEIWFDSSIGLSADTPPSDLDDAIDCVISNAALEAIDKAMEGKA